jgi:ERCC4-type nuclease
MVTIIVDNREKAPMDVVKVFPGTKIRRLEVGDYACSAGCCGFERKESDIFDMQRTLMQISELKKVYKNAYLLYNGNLDTFLNSSRGNKYAKLGFVASLTHQNMIPIPIKDYWLAFSIMKRVILKNHDGKVRSEVNFNHVRHINHKDPQINLLTSLPGVGKDKAKVILKKFGSPANFLKASKSQMEALPGFGPKSVEKIIDCLHA